MSPHQTQTRRHPRTGWAICAAGLILLACRREAPAPSPKSPPGSGTPDTSAAPPDSMVPTDHPVGVDDQDDPDAPWALPKTDEIRGWVKTRPVEPVTLDRLLEDDPRWEAIRTFRIRRAARCAYGLEDTTADVWFIEAAAPLDAFGVFSVLTPQPGQASSADRSVRATDVAATGLVMSGWQGNACVRIRFTGAGGEQIDRARDRLFGRILFNLPAADPPLLMRLIPPDKSAGTKLWVARSLAALAQANQATLRGIDAESMDARLGLTGEAALSVATVPVADDEPDNLIWLVEYQDPAETATAHARYQQALATPESDLDRNTFTLEPKGVFLAGSWTADQESVQNLLPRLREALPE